MDQLAFSIEQIALSTGITEFELRGSLFEIPHFEINGQVVIPQLELEKWLAKRAEIESRFYKSERRSKKGKSK